MSFRILLLAVVFAATACVDDPRNQPPQEVTWSQSLQPTMDVAPPKRLEFMVAPWLASNELVELYTPLLANLSQTIEQPVRLNIAPDYPTLLRLLKAGKIDIAQVNARSFQTLLEEENSHHYVGTVVHLNKDDQPIYGAQGLLVGTTPTQLTASTAKDFRMGLVDKRSTSGFLLPTLWFNAHGFAIEDFKEVYYLGSHTKAFTALLSGKVDFVASWDGQLTLESARINNRIQQVIETGSLPNDAWVVAGADKDLLFSKVNQWANRLPSALEAPDLFPAKSAFAGVERIDTTAYKRLPRLPD